jgi:hypothetical protein
MGRDFMDVAVELERRRAGYHVIQDASGKPKYQPLNSLSSFVERFPVTRGLDHPGEIAAHMFGDVFLQDYLSDDGETDQTVSASASDNDAADGYKGKALFVPFRDWCRKNLKLDWEG